MVQRLVRTTTTDNDEAIERSKDDMEHFCTTKRTRGEHDVEAEIRALLKQLQIVKAGCVKGCQDKHNKRKDMKHEEWANALADEQATMVREEINRGRRQRSRGAKHSNESQVSLEFDGEAAHGNTKDAALRLMTAEDGKQETTHQCEWTHKCLFDWVDWDSMEVAMKKLKKQDCCRWLRTTKFMNNLLHTNAWAERCNGEDSKCLDCGEKENQQHMFTCRHEGPKEHRENLRPLLKQMMSKHGTAGESMNVIVVCFRRWEEHPGEDTKPEEVLVNVNGTMQPFRRNDEFSDKTFHTVQNQNEIGWENLLKGRMSKHWQQAQETCFRHNEKEKKHNGKTRGTQSAMAIWMCSESIWPHRNECKFAIGMEVLQKQRERLRLVVEKLHDNHEDRVRVADKHFFKRTQRFVSGDTQR